MAKSKSAKIAAIKQLTREAWRILETLSCVIAGNLFRSQLDDFVSGIFYLASLVEELDSRQLARLATEDNAGKICRDLKPTLKRLCQLSREITFSVDPDRLPLELREIIEKLFQFVGESVPEIADEEARDYLDNIGQRLMLPVAVV